MDINQVLLLAGAGFSATQIAQMGGANTTQPVQQPVAQPVQQPVAQPVAQPVQQPQYAQQVAPNVYQPVAQPVAQPVQQPVVQQTVQQQEEINMQALLNQMNNLTTAVQTGNAQTLQMQQPQVETSQSILASIIDPPVNQINK